MSSDAENDLFGDEAAASPSTSQPDAATSPGADDGDNVDNTNEADPHDLFGDEDENEPPRERSSSRPPASSPREHPLEYGEASDDENEEVSEAWASVPVPTWTRMHPTDGKVWQLKLPQHINLEADPYEANFYTAQLTGDDDNLRGSEAQARMLEVRNTMRWRWITGSDNKPARQANARILRWSDGSMSLQLGEDMYDVQTTWGTTVARESDNYERNEANSKGSQETSFVCYAAAEEQVLVTETATEGQLNLVPTSMDSKTHREHVRLVGQQHTKHSRMRLLEDEAAPERLAELLARAGPQKAAPVKKTRRAPGTGEPRNTFGRRSAFGRATKRADSEESEDDAGPRERRGGGGYDEDDGFVVADSDEEDAEYGKRKKNKRRNDDEEMDATELAEERIAAREKRERKRAKTKKSRAYSDDEDDEEDAAGEPDEEEDDEMEMDVESEDE
ncbi:uncharacterized protein CcaverHIS019_0102670 [Cutaneotrichosporon cavernicola]|uniref:Leo1-domain-containing protein n=1 Tax=Cutaneotrichosporon cavernicola TaxID=279322 RepID=A0AA48HXX3_9TREE|nr:uncharacterized protein CcaverHIS019_0102670 [Cutaneotrichosporon cavernicola]BEI87549.1 hypothetical protein CcaverHIS019_0102670 [Cutaneotrichosporon cavernicola]BEI95321.1 hypothetical protein CcaverHIS631_0102700 [Cutaneotrichosporon cavernicola]BEJ03094.1 hypothetical protein CcaverHIS641_0102690 [Cutaneotrichosporon cavernicola]